MSSAQRTSILAVIVLYKVPADESPSFTSLRRLLAENPAAGNAIEVMVCDNTPYEQTRPTDFHGLYHADTSNPGLARCYNLALKMAVEKGLPWLLLLDQDTTLTAEYVREAVEESQRLLDQAGIVALVPKLIQDDTVQSPHLAPTYRHERFDRAAVGRWPERLYAFNSASVIRVAALERAGGFQEEFWLDFLDHATFHELQRDGGRVFVLASCLQHDLSANSVVRKDDAGKRRYQNVLDAEHTFYRKYGSFSDRLYRRIRLMRGCLGQLIKQRNVGESLQMLKAAIRI